MQSVRTYLAEPLRTDPGKKSWIGVRELISTQKKSAGGEWLVEHSPKILASEKKKVATVYYFLLKGSTFFPWTWAPQVAAILLDSLTKKSIKKKSSLDCIHTSATDADLVHDVTDTDCQT